MKILGVIPARYASSRFPGKALADVKGKTMVRRVYEQARQSKLLNNIVVATDDQRIFNEVLSFEGQVMMTQEDHKNGTERCAEVIRRFQGYDYVINIQGDEPFIHPDQIDTVAQLLDGHVEIATLVKPIKDIDELDDPGEMKVVFNNQNEAIYFSRACIPYLRDVDSTSRLKHYCYHKHIGIYAYRSDVLMKIVKLPPGNLEMAESLEQLRWIENGFKINLGFTDIESHMIDTPQDLTKLLKTTPR
ncbi:MAG: 3-deoxy-manno-octulosonate cytidylyltransferase [Marinoscillum sp.]